MSISAHADSFSLFTGWLIGPTIIVVCGFLTTPVPHLMDGSDGVNGPCDITRIQESIHTAELRFFQAAKDHARPL